MAGGRHNEKTGKKTTKSRNIQDFSTLHIPATIPGIL